MLGYKLEAGKTYKITQGLLMNTHHHGFEMVGKVKSVDVQSDYAIVYGVQSETDDGKSCFGYLWDVPHWSTQFHTRIIKAEEII